MPRSLLLPVKLLLVFPIRGLTVETSAHPLPTTIQSLTGTKATRRPPRRRAG